MISKKTFAKVVIALLVLLPVTAPIIANASSGGTYQTPSLWPTGYWGPLVSCTGNYLRNNGDSTVPNSCTDLCDLIGTATNIIVFMMSVAIFIIAPISFVVGGIMIMIAGANPGMLEQGKKILTGAVVGLALVLCSYLIVATFISAIGITGIGGFGTPACSIQ
jgi:hypothetical protein